MAKNTVPTTKRELRKHLNQWLRGDVSKRELDVSFGMPKSGGKFVTRLWEDRLGVETRQEGSVATRYTVSI